MLEPTILAPRPSTLMCALGGLTATILLMSLTFLAPIFGFPFFDVPRISGGVFLHDPTAAFWLGAALFFVGGVVVLPAIFDVVWEFLPGRQVTILGAIAKGALWGIILSALSGIALPFAVTHNHFPRESLIQPGVNWLAVVAVVGGHLVYGIALALMIVTARGMRPLDTLGWAGHAHADVVDIALRRPKHPGHLGEAPAWKSKTTDESSSSSTI